jgi:uncharacterized membrane protein YgcG
MTAVLGSSPGVVGATQPPALGLTDMPTARQEPVGTGVVRLPHLMAGGVVVAGRNGQGRSDRGAHGTVLASLIGAAPSGEIIPPNPPQIPAPPPPTAEPVAPIPARIPTPPPPEQPPSPPQQVEPPAVAPQPGGASGSGGSGGGDGTGDGTGGGGDGGGGDGPAEPMPPGWVRLAP